jgi:hypothetical protein
MKPLLADTLNATCFLACMMEFGILMSASSSAVSVSEAHPTRVGSQSRSSAMTELVEKVHMRQYNIM